MPTTDTRKVFTSAYRNGDIHLHKHNCRDLQKADPFEGRYYALQPIVGTLTEAHRAAALDRLEAVDYGDGEYADDIEAGINAYLSEVNVYSCTKSAPLFTEVTS